MKSFKELYLAHEIDQLIESTLDDDEFDDLYEAITYDGTDADALLIDWADRLGYSCSDLRVWWNTYHWD